MASPTKRRGRLHGRVIQVVRSNQFFAVGALDDDERYTFHNLNTEDEHLVPRRFAEREIEAGRFRSMTERQFTNRFSFRVGQVLLDTRTSKLHRVEVHDSHFGFRYLLRSIESSNPGTPKSGEFIELQMQDGYLRKLKPKEVRDGTF